MCPIDGGIYSAFGPHLAQCPCTHHVSTLAPCFPIPTLTLSPTHTHFWLPHTTTQDAHAHFFPHHHHPPSVPPIAGHPQQKKSSSQSARRLVLCSTLQHCKVPPASTHRSQTTPTGPTERRPPQPTGRPLPPVARSLFCLRCRP